jgi:hypothetical protein
MLQRPTSGQAPWGVSQAAGRLSAGIRFQKNNGSGQQSNDQPKTNKVERTRVERTRVEEQASKNMGQTQSKPGSASRPHWVGARENSGDKRESNGKSQANLKQVSGDEFRVLS